MTAIDTSSTGVAPRDALGLATAPALAARPASAVSWPAIFAGGATAAAISLLLLALGSGLGLATAGPWLGHGASPKTLTAAMLIWLIVMQWIASGMGGYITGRLRTRWLGVHTHEVFFRDTAHGLLTWALATLFAAALLGSALTGAGDRAADVVRAGGATGGADAAQAASPFVYDSDYLFRSVNANLPPSNAQARADAQQILATGLAHGGLSGEDSAYLNSSIVAQTGVAPAEAQRRIDAVSDREQQVLAAANTARKTAASLAIFTSLSMLIGALIACVAAALGGMQRDEHL